MIFNEKKHLVKKGNIYVLKEGIHYEAMDKKSLFVFNYSKPFFDDLLYSQIADCRIIFDLIQSKNRKEYLFFNFEENSIITSAIQNLSSVYHLPEPYQDKLRRLSLVEVISLLDCYRDQYLVLNESTMVSNHRFGKILKYMGDYYASVTLSELANKFNYNPDYLSYVFHKITHQTFSQKLLDIRLEQSTRLLEYTELTIEEISLQIGFKDKSYFNRKFKEHYQCTPKVYRRKKKVI